MALEKQIVGIDFTQGLDTQTDERLVVPGKLLTLQNMTFSTNNALSPRGGWAQFPTKALTTPAGIYYMVADSTTGAIIKGRTALVISAVSSCPRVAAITETSGASDADCFIVPYVSGVSGLG